MRSIASALLALAACNQVFGSRAVQEAPPEIFDAPIDAPFACPMIGSTPQYSPFVHQFLFENCSYFAVAGGRAIAECLTAAGGHAVFEGEVGDTLLPATGTPTSGMPLEPRASPDGKTLFLLEPLSQNIIEFDRGSTSEGWSYVDNSPIATGNVRVYSTIAQDHVLVSDEATQQLVEYRRGTPHWEVAGMRTWAELGLTPRPESLALTSDGLRMIATTRVGSFYTDRPDLATPFRRPDPIEAPSTSDVFITDDCSRIYLSGLGEIFYAQQR